MCCLMSNKDRATIKVQYLQNVALLHLTFNFFFAPGKICPVFFLPIYLQHLYRCLCDSPASPREKSADPWLMICAWSCQKQKTDWSACNTNNRPSPMASRKTGESSNLWVYNRPVKLSSLYWEMHKHKRTSLRA